MPSFQKKNVIENGRTVSIIFKMEDEDVLTFAVEDVMASVPEELKEEVSDISSPLGKRRRVEEPDESEPPIKKKRKRTQKLRGFEKIGRLRDQHKKRFYAARLRTTEFGEERIMIMSFRPPPESPLILFSVSK